MNKPHDPRANVWNPITQVWVKEIINSWFEGEIDREGPSDQMIWLGRGIEDSQQHDPL